MAYRIARRSWWRLWRPPWAWVILNSAYGSSWGRAWTRRGAEKQLLMEQGRWFAER